MSTISQNNDNTKMRIHSVKLSEFEARSTAEKETRDGWVTYGDKNDYPLYLKELAELSPVHGTLCTSISQIIAGDGVTGISPLIQRFFGVEKVVKRVAYDLKTYGMAYIEVIRTADGEGVAAMDHLPFEQMRLAKSDENDDITGAFYCRDWKQTRKYPPQFIPLFDRAKWTATDDDGAMTEPKQVYIMYATDPSSGYYGKPDYHSAIYYIELSRQIGIYHLNNILNGLFPSFIVNLMNGIPDPDEKAKVIAEFEKQVSGARNAGKIFFTFNDPTSTAPTVTAFPLSDADKQYEFLSKASTENIMVGHRVVSPLLFGIRDTGGGLGSNSDELRQALAIFNMFTVRPMQSIIETALSEIMQQPVVITPFNYEVVEFAPNNRVDMAAEKKKTCLNKTGPNHDDAKAWIARLEATGEQIDEDEWELVREDEAGDAADEKEVDAWIARQIVNLSLADYANGEERSEEDSGLYKLRYTYAGDVQDNTREFCREMRRIADTGKVWRFEDIESMSDAGENGQFAPAGQSSYDIFTWKGGVYCHHYWKRLIYFRKRKNGKFLPNDGLKNEIRVGNVPFVRQKGPEGTPPIDTPTRGSLKYA